MQHNYSEGIKSLGACRVEQVSCQSYLNMESTHAYVHKMNSLLPLQDHGPDRAEHRHLRAHRRPVPVQPGLLGQQQLLVQPLPDCGHHHRRRRRIRHHRHILRLLRSVEGKTAEKLHHYNQLEFKRNFFLQENRCMLGTYFAIILAFFIILIVGAVVGYSQSLVELKKPMIDSMAKYNPNDTSTEVKTLTDAWDKVQTDVSGTLVFTLTLNPYAIFR